MRATRVRLLCLSLLALLALPRPGRSEEDPASPPRAAIAPATRPSLTPLSRVGLDRWHQSGHRGHGIKVAILDSGWRGYREFLGQALPAKVDAKSFRSDGNLEAKESQHGILCAEVIHSLAPDADILLANWEPDAPPKFLDAVRWARERGANVISCSVIMPCWSDGEGGGPIHAGLSRVLGDGTATGDVLFFSCAGNIAQRAWSGRFADNGAGFHQWRPDSIDNVITAWDDEPVSAELCWPGGGSYRVVVTDAATGQEVGRAQPKAAGDGHCAVVRFQPKPRAKYRLRIQRLTAVPEAATAAGTVSGTLHVTILGGWLDQNTARGSIPFPGDGASVVTIGAMDADGRRVAYSSCGPNSSQPKPDFVAAVPYPSLWRAKPFSGTSAATPQAAGLAATLWSKHPEWTAGQLRLALQQSARDIAPPGHDWETGYGQIRLPAE